MSCAAYRITTKAEAQAKTVIVTARSVRHSEPGLMILSCRICSTVLVTGQAWPELLLRTSELRFWILCRIREMLHFERLQALHAVSTFGSVTGAAAALHLTPSAVSQQLAKLQRDVGQRLIEPYGRGVRLTPAGVLLARRAHAILSEVESAEGELDRERERVVGDLEVAGFATAARAILPQAVVRLRKEHEQLRLRVSERQPDEAIRLVVAGHLDIALVNDWMNAPLILPEGVERLLIMNDPVDLAVAADHLLAQRTSVELTELCAEQWITWPHGAICHEWLTQTLRQHGLTPEVTHTAEEHQTQLALVAAGLGIAVMPRLGRGPSDGVAIVSLKPAFSRRVYAIWRTLASERPAIAVTVSAIRDVATDLSIGEEETP
jgi:DNA-binding transcriptional LysR family regulator